MLCEMIARMRIVMLAFCEEIIDFEIPANPRDSTPAQSYRIPYLALLGVLLLLRLDAVEQLLELEGGGGEPALHSLAMKGSEVGFTVNSRLDKSVSLSRFDTCYVCVH